MIKIINLNVILFSLAIAYGILKIIESYNDKKIEYSAVSEEYLPEQGSWIVGESYSGPESLADIDYEFTFDAETAKFNSEMAKTKDAFKAMKEEIEKEVSNIHIPKKSSLRFSSEILRNSFKYRLDNCVYKESEDESCKNGAVDLGIDKICCNIIVWDIYYWRKANKLSIVPNSNITIDNKTYKHDFMDCFDGKYNSNGYYHINNLKVVSSSPGIPIRNMLYWFYPVHTDFSCKLNVRRIAEWDDFLSNYNDIVERYSRSVAKYSVTGGWGPFSKKDDVTNTVAETEELDFGDEVL